MRSQHGAVNHLRVGALYIFAGSMASVAAASISVLLQHPGWIRAFVAAPAVLVGGYELVDPTRLPRVLAVAVAFPVAVGGLDWGLREVRQREAGEATASLRQSSNWRATPKASPDAPEAVWA